MHLYFNMEFHWDVIKMDFIDYFSRSSILAWHKMIGYLNTTIIKALGIKCNLLFNYQINTLVVGTRRIDDKLVIIRQFVQYIVPVVRFEKIS